jgi:hypothetical protein
MKSLKLLFGISTLTLSTVSAFALSWEHSGGQSCNIACRDLGKLPVSSGNYSRNGNPFYVCSANAEREGFRAGYNLIPVSTNTCTVGWGGHEKSYQNYMCLCQ